jgi:PAS domain S-box-containing protein
MKSDDPSLEWLRGASTVRDFVRSHDWAATPLGPPVSWPPQLRALAQFVLSNPLPMLLLWGNQWVQIGNDALADLLWTTEGFGAPVPPDWHRHWDIAKSPFTQLANGQSCSYEDRFRWFSREGGPKSSWFTLHFSPVLTDAGEVTGAVMIVTDTTRQAMAELTAENSTDRLRALLKVTPDSIFRLAANGTDLIDLDGREFTRSIAGPATDWLQQILPPGDEAAVAAALQQGIAIKRPFELEHRVIRRDGSVGWSGSRAVPIFDITRRVKEWYGAMTDISSRKEVEERLRSSERQFRRFGHASRDLLWIRNGHSFELEYLSPAASEICGEPIELAQARERWAALIHPADRAGFLANLERVQKGEALHHEYRIRRHDHTIRWIQSYDFPILDESGRLHQIAGIARDVTDSAEFEVRQQLVVMELNHRTRNLITLAQAIVTRTLDSCDTVDEFEEVVEQRLHALASASDLLCHAHDSHSLTFDELVYAMLRTLGTEGDPRISLGGSGMTFIESAHVPALALAFHELMSNAIKHGGLSEATGRVAIHWLVRTGFEPRLVVEWRETSSQGPGWVTRRQGREMIEDSLRYCMKAEACFEPTETGFRYTLSIPVAARADP